MQRPGIDDEGIDLVVRVVVALVGAVALVAVLVWLAGQFSSVLAGNGWPDSGPQDAIPVLIRLVSDPTNPANAWPEEARAALGPTWLIVTVLGVLLLLAAYGAMHLVRFALNWRRRREYRMFRLGFASGSEIRKQLGVKAVLRKAKSVRPSTAGRKNVRPEEVGFYLGRDIRSKQRLYGSAEDVMIILAPPRQGKDVHFCTPYTIDAPGPVIVTSTRADAFTNTYTSRAKKGKVWVFDPNGMTCWPERLRWSPIRGCDHPTVAANRANAMILGTGLSLDNEYAFIVIGAIGVLRSFLHAAAVGRKSLTDVLRWTREGTSMEPIDILRVAEDEGRAAPGWSEALKSATIDVADPRVRSAMMADVSMAFDCMVDPVVFDACSPSADELFNVKEFLSGQNTLYILGKEGKNGTVAPLVTALMEDLLDTTRGIAARMPGGRLDPPLTIELNESAHIAPLPNLPSYMGDSGGFSIALHVYLQSFSQAKAIWGDHESMIMWDNAAVRVIMGGAGNVHDLDDISRLMGEFNEKRKTVTTGNDRRLVATQPTPRRVLSPEEIRTLEFGTAVVVSRAARPVEVKLTPWWERKDAREIAAGKAETEKRILQYTEQADRRRAGHRGPPALGNVTIQPVEEIA